MKKILIIWLLTVLSLPMTAGIHSYADRSLLASGTWVKISVSGSGVCRMSFDEISAAGLNPSELRVFGYGGAQLNQDFSKSKIDDLPQVPVYVGTDYVLFYVQGPISWEYSNGRYVHTKNTYSDLGYYFLTDNIGTKMAPPSADATAGTVDVYTYLNQQVHELDSVNLIDRSGVSGAGKEFYGEQFTNGKKRTFTFSTPNANPSAQCTIYADMAALATTLSTFTVTLNGSSRSVSINAPTESDHYTFGMRGSTSYSTAAKANQQQAQLSFSNNTASGALGWLNYIEISTPCSLRMSGDWMTIYTNPLTNPSSAARYHMSNADANTQIWDITDLSAITRRTTSLNGTELTWNEAPQQQGGLRKYVAVNTRGTNFVHATVVGNVANQNIHKLKNIDYVIICPEGYESEARRLAQAHEAKQSITWAVVTDKQVYNEFSSGTPDATAYRWLMKMLYDRATNGDGQKPRWLLLLGHGSYDNRGRFSNSGTRLLLTYQADNSLNEVKAYASDDYFGWLDDSEGTNDIAAKMDIGVGRLPVESVEEAGTTIDKLIGYMQNDQPGKWKNQLVYLADDGDRGQHTETAEGSAEGVRKANPDFVVHKIYLDAYPQEVNASGESYPLAKNRVMNLLKSGVFFFDYSGHGGYNAITSESILALRDIEKMNNQHLGFWAFITCNFGHFDSGQRCAAETALMNPNGGAVGVLSATRTVYASPNTNLNRAFTTALFKHADSFHYEATLGEALAAAKNTLGVSDDGNKMAYVLIGDPAMRLNFPTDYWVKTTTKMDTLNALSVQQVEGQIIDEDSLLVGDFNGKLDVTVYDKMQVIATRDNDDTSGEPAIKTYNDYPNIIFTGSTTVRDGLFAYTFMVPKDIRYNFGKGRIVYYAHDDEHNEDAVGHFEKFIVGGTGSIVAVDTVGPEMTIYLNSPAFQNGQTTYPTPRFFADLYDRNGINTAGAGIGHDLMLVIDDDPKQTYSINEYFTAANASYQQGQVSYLMEALPDGPHTLSFRAWDLMNNSTTKSLNFIVDANSDPSIYSVMTYPNPVQQAGIMNMVVLYDQPDELLTTEIYVYNLNGQILWSRVQNNPDQIQLNLAEMNLRPGVYVYSVKIKSATSKYSTCSGKIIVTN